MKLFSVNPQEKFQGLSTPAKKTEDIVIIKSPIEETVSSCSSVIPRAIRYIGQFMTTGLFLMPEGEYGRKTSKQMHGELLHREDWITETKDLFDQAKSAVPKKELAKYLSSIDTIDEPGVEYKAGFSDGEKVYFNSYKSRKERYERAMAYFDYEITRPSFWSSSDEKMVEIFRKTHEILGKNYSKDQNAGKFREVDIIVFPERFSQITYDHGIEKAVRECVKKGTSEKEIRKIIQLLKASPTDFTQCNPQAVEAVKKQFFVPTNFKEVDDKMKKVAQKLKQTREKHLLSGKSDPVDLAVMAHQEITEVHPFVNGNGRTARLIMNGILMSAGKTPPIFIDDDDYISSVQQGHEALKKTTKAAMAESDRYYNSQAVKSLPPIKPAAIPFDRPDLTENARQALLHSEATSKKSPGIFTPIFLKAKN